MKVPHTIPKSACKAYKPSKECLSLPGELSRILKAELVSWDEALPKNLSDIAVEALIRNFKDIPLFDAIPLEKDRNLLLETLPLDLALDIVIPIIPDGIYWQRRALDRWSMPMFGTCNIAQHNNSWKQLYLERDLQEWIEKIVPGDEADLGVMGPNGWSAWQYNRWVNPDFGQDRSSSGASLKENIEDSEKSKKDMFGPENDIDEGKQVFEYGGDYKDQFPESGEDDEDEEEDEEEEDDLDDEMSDDLAVRKAVMTPEVKPKTMEKVAWVASYIRHLNLRELQVGHPSPPPPEDSLHNCVAEPPCIDHIDLGPILSKLVHLQELSIIYEVRNLGIDFAWNYFTVSMGDIENLSRGLSFCSKLKTFRLRKSNLNDEKVAVLVQSLVSGVEELETLDLSHNNISDEGAIALGNLISKHRTLKRLILCNNMIGSRGVEGLSYALKNNAPQLTYLNLRLNSLVGDEGGSFLSSALNYNQSITSLVLAACGLRSYAGKLMGKMLQLNTSLIELDLSNNSLGEEAGKSLEAGLVTNKTLQKLDIRMTEISKDVEYNIFQALARNKPATSNWEISELSKELKEEPDYFASKIHLVPSETPNEAVNPPEVPSSTAENVEEKTTD